MGIAGLIDFFDTISTHDLLSHKCLWKAHRYASFVEDRFWNGSKNGRGAGSKFRRSSRPECADIPRVRPNLNLLVIPNVIRYSLNELLFIKLCP